MVLPPATEAPVRPRRPRPCIGLLTHGAGDPNSQAVWKGVQSAARDHGAHVFCFPGKPLASPHGFEAQSNVVYELVGPENVDGLVIWTGALCHTVDLPAMSAFCQRYAPLPMVTIGHPLLAGIPGVALDNYQVMRDVVAHLVEFHHLRRIAFVQGPQHHPEAERRFQAYLDVLADNNIPFDPALVAQGNFKESGGMAAVPLLMDERRVRFDALVAASDNMALGAMKALQRRGVRIPGEVAVAGLNDELQGRFITPPLTTAPFRSFEMAHRAAEMLLARLDGKDIPERVMLPSRLLVRQSCGCADPLVALAGAAPCPERHASAATLEARQPAILAELAADRAPFPETEPPPAGLEKLVGAFMEEMGGGADGAFLAALSDLLHETLLADGTVSPWQDTISELRRQSLPCLRDESSRLRAEGLWQQARVILGESGQRFQAYQALQAQEETRILGGIGQALGNVVSLEDLEQVLALALPSLGIGRAYLALYEDHAAPLQSARLVMGCEGGEPLALEPGGRPFPPRQLVPLDWAAGLQADLVVEPLFYRNEQLGFLVLEAEPHLEEECEILREQIAGALKRCALYRQTEQARRVAEDGRRLAEEANRLKSRFLSTVSHELRTPLSLIVGTIEMLLRERAGGSPLPPAYQRDLRTIGTSAQHLARLIGDVLDLASSQAGELHLVRAPVRLDEALAPVTMLGETMAREKGLSWASDLPAELPVVWGDRTRLQQVVLNLITNAVKFTQSGHIRLWAETGRDKIVVAVSDSGMGIPLDEQDLIFDEFRQSERAARRGYGGMGLGLAISRQLVELHGGQIGVLSTGVDGAGSTFYFTLPLAAAGEKAATVRASGDRNVLVLTEHAERCGPLLEHLTAGGFTGRLLTITDSANWVGEILAAPPGAIVLDFEPDADTGWALMQILRRNTGTQDIPIIFYTLAEQDGRGAFIDLDFLAKPITPTDLTDALSRQGLDLSGSGRVILVVDDDPDILKLHARLLAEVTPACRVLTAENGREALALMAQRRPDLVLLDLMMPVLDGFGVLDAMRKSARTRDIPVIVLTAQVLTRREMARLQQGVAAVLSKGLFSGPEVLAQVTDALCRRKRLGNEAQRVMRQVMAYIHEHYAEPLSREALAQAVGLSDRHLTKAFHAETGLTPIVYLTRYRIQQACVLLERGESSITEVALATGFADPSYFARVFREVVGVTPRAYQHGERAGSGPTSPAVPSVTP